ncbi:MAG: tRNA (adenosine(37)-N6)-dimethylallyltransferase MiaA [Frankiaceae bacterium]|nr:tRNA (adenosine(37)-N6)-dimethylallyltransferase MiaA [Frankiaceae bacterium]MBV9871569.1 tRNA (adenosine(37)-N6)-dimethylallyltransferase MiaA [Frankiaceae bacterium]
MPRVVAVVGPTATGKSALGVAIAAAVGGEVINADSMQLYRGMDIGTAKLTDAERSGVPHHLLDIWDVTQTASVADYQARARGRIDELLAGGVTPVLVGGSGLYVRAVLDRIEFPGTDAEVRGQLEADLAEVGAPALHARLAAVDPAAASAIAPENGRKIVRALEVMALTGQPFTAALPTYDEPYYDAVQIGLDLPTNQLDLRITKRVEHMIEQGFLDEVRALDAVGLRDGVTASRALGYAQLLAVIDGRRDLAAAIAETAQATRRFVRRQRSWFRRDPRITWHEPSETLLADALQAIGASSRS